MDQARKKSFRLLFKSPYGPTKLRYPVFESAVHHAWSATDRFDTLVLRAGGNANWSKDDAYKQEPCTYLRDQFIRDTAIEMVGLGDARKRPAGEYSKGMQRRLGLAQALINDPDLLVLDEPTAGLDPIGTRQVKDLVQELGRRGKTVLVTSHLLADVEDVCSRLAILYAGRIRQSGTVGELLTETEALMLRTDPLSEATLGAFRSLLEKEGKQLHSVRAPRQPLEKLFLQIVERARSEGTHSTGAGRGGPLPEFLRSPRSDKGSKDED